MMAWWYDNLITWQCDDMKVTHSTCAPSDPQVTHLSDPPRRVPKPRSDPLKWPIPNGSLYRPQKKRYVFFLSFFSFFFFLFLFLFLFLSYALLAWSCYLCRCLLRATLSLCFSCAYFFGRPGPPYHQIASSAQQKLWYRLRPANISKTHRRNLNYCAVSPLSP